MKKEDFGCMYRIKEYFSDMDSQIKRFDCGTGENPAVEELKQKRKAMYEIVRELNRTDLQILYYLHNLQLIKPHKILSALKKVYQSQEELLGLCGQKDE
ncbi:MAG: hypothetical protein IJX09_03680 [Clostridia bacterium]|nr:hypothetical protein [Clostridia bacterium]